MMPILGFLGPFRSRVRSRHATDRQTDTAHHFIMLLPTEVGVIINDRLVEGWTDVYIALVMPTRGKTFFARDTKMYFIYPLF